MQAGVCRQDREDNDGDDRHCHRESLEHAEHADLDSVVAREHVGVLTDPLSSGTAAERNQRVERCRIHHQNGAQNPQHDRDDHADAEPTADSRDAVQPIPVYRSFINHSTLIDVASRADHGS